MDSKLDFVFYTENKGKKFALQWIIGDILKIPGTLESPKFSFFPESCPKDWFLCVEISDVKSASVSLHHDFIYKIPLRLEYTVTFRKPDGKWISEVSGNHTFDRCDSIVLHSNLNEIVKLGCTDTLNLEFTFIIHGMDMETEALYYTGGDCDKDFKLSKNAMNLMENKKLIDLKIHVGKETFQAHKFILRLRAPKFVDEYLEDLNVKEITVEGMQPDAFRDFLSYIYRGTIPLMALSHCTEELYEFASKYDLKVLQKKCVDELEHLLKVENAVEYLKKAVKYQDETLNKVTSSFIKNHLGSIQVRREWEELVSSKPELTEEVMNCL